MFKRIMCIVAILLVSVFVWKTFLGAAKPLHKIEPAAGAEKQDQITPVTVHTLASQEIQQWHNFSGKLVAVDRVDIRARVAGAIQKIYFQEGAQVKKGDPLFLIDPRPYAAEVNRQAAALASAEAQSSLALSESTRAERLVKDNAISRREYEMRSNAAKVAAAAVQSAQAALQQAKLNLGYATIVSPIEGKVGRAEITLGNLVDPAQGQILTEVVSTDPIYADFEIDEQTYLKNVRQTGEDNASLPVQLVINGDASVTYEGKVTAFDNKLDPTSGTIRVRALFANHDRALVPGMFVTVRMGSAEKRPVILISESIVNTDQDRKVVYLVDKDNKVEYRPVTLGSAVDGLRIVEEGLQDGDRVITKGLQRIRPGMSVQPQEETPETPVK